MWFPKPKCSWIHFGPRHKIKIDYVLRNNGHNFFSTLPCFLYVYNFGVHRHLKRTKGQRKKKNIGMHKTNEHILFQTKRSNKKRSDFLFYALCVDSTILHADKMHLPRVIESERKIEREKKRTTKRNRKKSKIINRIQCVRLIQKSKHTPKMKTKLPTHTEREREREEKNNNKPSSVLCLAQSEEYAYGMEEHEKVQCSDGNRASRVKKKTFGSHARKKVLIAFWQTLHHTTEMKTTTAVTYHICCIDMYYVDRIVNWSRRILDEYTHESA